MFNGESEGLPLRIAVRRWAACAAGLDGLAAWREWSRRPWLPVGDGMPALPAMAPMLKRRLNRLGRLALQAAWDCQGDELGVPIVFASRYGDAARSLALLEDLMCGREVSPTGFNMSVHNAIGALYAIARADRSNTVSLAAGRASAGAGLLEAAALMADGAPEVMLVCYDDTLPEPYEAYRDEAPCAWAWAWRVARAVPGEAAITLSTCGGVYDDVPAAAALPAGLDVLRFFLSGEPRLEQRLEGRRWVWQREAADA